MGMSKYPLPQPVSDSERKAKVQVDENHGLWGFFNEKKTALSTPKDDDTHGKLFLVGVRSKIQAHGL